MSDKSLKERVVDSKRDLDMDYDQFITEIQIYWDMRKKGLKKQANSFLFAFAKQF